MSRRRFLAGAGTIGALGVTGGLGLLMPGPKGQTGTLLTSQLPLPPKFASPLPVPPEARPSGGRYELTAHTVEREILPGRRTRILSYGGSFPAPTIRARRGQPLDLLLRNELDVETVIHLHGGRTPPESDGYPTDVVLPPSGQVPHHLMAGDITTGQRTYHYPLDQRAATLWYHDHTMDYTAPNVYFGMAGFFLIGDDEEDALPLPGGDRELPLMICDRAFDADGQFRYPAISPERRVPGVTEPYMGGVLGDVILVNGAPWPEHQVSATRYRLRLLNASNARRYELDLGMPMVQIGTDGGLLEQPMERRTVTLAPAERADVIVDFSAAPVGTRVTMHNRLGDGGTAEVMRFHVVRHEPDDTEIPQRLSTIEPLDPGKVSAVRDIRFRLTRPPGGGQHGGHHGASQDSGMRWTVNDQVFDPEVSLAEPGLGDTEIWRFSTDVHHPVHLHLVHMQVLSRNGGNPRKDDRGWKDTVDLIPGETCEVLTRFDGYRGRYVFHCHNLEHEDMAMMANFTVT
ncbi:multicopper oxidase family protein [Amycolatopsis arida]|nr:multicopper oxidase domain-containing protein [Amycolatopsis arida]